MSGDLGLAGVLPEEFRARLAAQYKLVDVPNAAAAASHGIEVLVAAGAVDAAMIAALPSLRYIHNFGVGYEKIDIVAAASRAIMVTHNRGVGAASVAEAAIGLMLGLGRRIVEGDRFIRDRGWGVTRFPLSASIAQRRLGVAGLGNIGTAIAQRAAGFGMEVGYYSRSASPTATLRRFASLLELADFADYLVVTLPGGEQTRGLVDSHVLKALGPGGYLINVGRGSVVDEAALIDALETGAIAGAGLDVFADEPHVPERLLRCNVVVTPHQAGATRDSFEQAMTLTLENLAAYFSGQPLDARVA